MSQDQWSAVDNYFYRMLNQPDAALENVLQVNREQGFPSHDVSENQGVFLRLLAEMQGARRILEVGTLGGYSTICLARALPTDGRLFSFEIDPKRVAIARKNVELAGLTDRVEIIEGPAADSLDKFALTNPEPFDFVFIDADKKNNSTYFRWALRFSRPGTVIIVDNVVRAGAILSESTENPCVLGVRRLNELIASEPRVEATALQTVGTKGWDGFIMARVRSS